VGLIVLTATGFITQRVLSTITKQIQITKTVKSTVTPIPAFIVLPTPTPTSVLTPAPTATPLPPTATPVPPIINYQSGFHSQSGLQLNGNSVYIGDKLRLTTSANWLAGSAFFTTPVPITTFSTSFRFQFTTATADGITFTIQNAGATTLGSMGSGLGYGGIPTSVAIKFDLWSSGNTANTTGIFTNGTYPDQPETLIQGLDFHSEHVFRVGITYNGKTLNVQETDEFTGASLQQSYAGDIPTIVGGPTAYVGFTGATGAYAIQEILNWSFQN